MIKLILSIILIICFIINSIESFKMITLTTGPPSDLGWNNMINLGRIGVTKAMDIEDSRLFVVSGRNDTYELLLPIIQNDDIDLVICSSLDHGDACKEIAAMYVNSTEIKTQFLVRGSGATTKNLIQFTYNYASVNYLSGMFAGLQTKTNKIGFISPGITAGASDCFVYAFWLGAKSVNPNIKFYYYNIGSYLDKDKTKGAAENLIDVYDCDVIGDTLDDFTASNVAISRGRYAIGTNGFPQRDVYGENVVYTYAYNWTKYFVPIASAVKNKIPPSKWYADFNKDNNLSLYDLSFGFQVSAETKFKIINQTKSFASYVRTLHPYFCNEYMEGYTQKYNLTRQPNTTNCITTTGFIGIDAPVGDMNYLGNYTIKFSKVEFQRSIQIGFSIVSGLLIGFVILMMIGIVKYQDTPSIRSASPSFLNLTLLGGVIIFIGIIVWVAPISTHQCNARFWLVTIGFSTLIGSLVVKNIRIWLIFDNPELKIRTITNNQLYPWVGLCLVINIVLMSIITTVGDLKAIEAQGIDSLGKFEYMTICKMNYTGAATLYSILAYFGTLLLVGVFVSWKIRIVHIEEFSECTAIAKTLYSISFCLFVIVPLMISPQDKQSETIILCVTGIFITTGALLIFFLPKFWRIFGNEKQGSHEHFTQRKQSAVASARAESANRNNSSNSFGFSKSSAQIGNTISGIESLNDDSNESSLSNETK
ncbi:G-protein-coupled receptor family 3 protein 10 [Dictyostelium discoideum AX4]|uniref:Metabotropic glutamate receptor-like protein K n=1 Tax=Dictyostelium discoideum TaxID=44689 RepID=GRLK_DICDI|nr:G-protein-coupled receptor family 3 protein 10 [Dictyostelium discoideum AX4]Q1ZXQ7.1 RecName: Full=Metabotropic glutamate receptor-like protein K; Flags: Precursor [Dictyostelium discoideum]EAS66931.1 G-protein-coupled receptor family 3 protein 10 [Dictyostelium discoideum AX4]|eukprot:XP_001134467.1 G-protein-coupled receptor family 3 protein 10 [Dictyostelium discoideum AX4]